LSGSRDQMISVRDYTGQPLSADALVSALTTHLKGVAR
jgi:hypothetical protein